MYLKNFTETTLNYVNFFWIFQKPQNWFYYWVVFAFRFKRRHRVSTDPSIFLIQLLNSTYPSFYTQFLMSDKSKKSQKYWIKYEINLRSDRQNFPQICLNLQQKHYLHFARLGTAHFPTRFDLKCRKGRSV